MIPALSKATLDYDDPGIVYGNTGLWMIPGLSKATLDYG